MVEIIPIRGVPEIRPGDDLGAILGRALDEQGARIQDGDVVVVTQKVVSKAEGRIVPEGPGGRAAWVAGETRRVVARRGDLVIAETRHGFVCANAGVDASNVAEGFLTLLPEDPDASALRIREALGSRSGAAVAVVVTDTFGRPWRQGLVNVAIGCAGLPALVDLRGTKDANGRVLEATVEALADEVAAASGLVMGKADGIPAAIVRGIHREGPPLPGAALVRPPEEDLFRESPLQAVVSRSEAATFAPGDVPSELLREALLAAGSVVGPGGEPPWTLLEVGPGAARVRLAAAVEGAPAELVARAPLVVVGFAGPAARAPDGIPWSEDERRTALLAAGAALQRLVLALHALGLASCWIPPTGFRPDAVGRAVGVAGGLVATGVVAAGRPIAPA